MIGGRPAVLGPLVDVGLAHPAPEGLFGDPEVDGDLSDAQIIPTSSSDDVTLEFWSDLLRLGTSFRWE